MVQASSKGKGLLIKIAILFCIIVLMYLALDIQISKDEVAAYGELAGTVRMMGKSDFYVEYQEMRIDSSMVVVGDGDGSSGTNTGDASSADANGTITNSTGGGQPTGEVVSGYFTLYDGPTVMSGKARVIDAAKIRESNNLPKNKWASFENRTGVPNIWATDKHGQKLKIADMNLAKQTYRGRYMVAVGVKVMSPDYGTGKYVTADAMKYGTYIDIIVKDDKGVESYIPCVVACCKAHTHPNGIWQTSVAVTAGGKLEDLSSVYRPDTSMIEFTISDYIGRGIMAKHTLQKIVVYDGVYDN